MLGGYSLSDCRSYSGKVNLQRLKLQLVTTHGLVKNLKGVDFSFTLLITSYCLIISYFLLFTSFCNIMHT